MMFFSWLWDTWDWKCRRTPGLYSSWIFNTVYILVFLWQALLRVRSTKRIHQSSEWMILIHNDCFIHGEVIGFQVLLNSHHTSSTRVSRSASKLMPEWKLFLVPNLAGNCPFLWATARGKSSRGNKSQPTDLRLSCKRKCVYIICRLSTVQKHDSRTTERNICGNVSQLHYDVQTCTI